MSEFQNLVGEALRFWFRDTKLVENYRPDWLFGMELDFYLPDLNFAVEVQGRQHKLWVPDWQPELAEYHAQRRRDVSKRQIMRQRGGTLLCWHSFVGMQKSLRAVFPNRRFPTLPADLRARMKAYRRAVHVKKRDEWVAIKVKRGGKLVGINRVSADFLRGKR